MYFNLITVRPGFEREAAQEWLDGPYREHQWLWRFFDAPAGSPRSFIFRRRDAEDLPRFYVVSAEPPKAKTEVWEIHSREYRPQVPAGARLNFELRANPVIARSNGNTTQRHDVIMHEKKRLLAARNLTSWNAWTSDRVTPDGLPDSRPDVYEIAQRTCSDWLADRGQRHGFELDRSSVSVSAYQQHGGKRGQLRFSTVDLAGELMVTDAQRFVKTLTNGVGRAKAFGCGLLLVRYRT